MDHQIGWHPEAYEELREIIGHIAADSTTYASIVASRIVSAADDLIKFPRMGRRVPEWDDDAIRERIVYQYRMIYRIRGERILILAIIHGARLLQEDIVLRS